MKRREYLILFLLIFISGCGANDKQKNSQERIQMHYVCSLDENITTLGQVLSLDVAADGSFIVSNGNDIIGYDPSGRQRFAWNKKGRGPNEYLVAKHVRATNNAIYVWDSGSAKLFAYDLNGNGLWTYDYDSAICDFYPTDTAVFFYPCGRKWEHIVQELDIESMSIVHSFGSTSMAHKAMHAMDASVPLTIQNGSLFYMTRDKLDLFQVKQGGVSLVKQFTSNSFRCREIKEDLFANNLQAGIEFVSQNSFVLSVSVSEDGMSYKLLTAEGSADPNGIQQTGRVKLSNNTLVFRLYKINSETQSVSVCERVFDPTLISEKNGSFYVLVEDRDNEAYQLVTLE